MTAFTLRTLFSDIRFWLLFFFLLRFLAITEPPLEVAHNWRQTTVTMVARNFLEEDANILYPRVDFAGDKTGITGMEFPLLNYLIFLVSKIFGYAHWYGRLINLIISTIGIWFFYKLVARYFTDRIAFYAAFMLILSVWFTYSRKIMPDTFSVSLVIMGLYYCMMFLETKHLAWTLVAGTVLLLLGVLSKLPSVCLLVVMLPLLINKNISFRTRLIFVALNSVALVLNAVYYFYWVPRLNQEFGLEHFFMGKSIHEGASDIAAHLNQALQKFYQEALGISGFLIFVGGLIYAIIKKQTRLLFVFAAGFAAFLIVILKAGFGFYHHTYYIVPFAPFMALVAGYALDTVPKKTLAATALVVFSSEAIATKFVDFHINPEYQAIERLEPLLDALSEKRGKVLINSGNVPTPVYFTHRKGWIETNEKIQDTAWVKTLEGKGLRHIIVLKKIFGKNMELNYPKVYDSEDFSIYDIRSTK
jgi:hypothetical protein